MLAYDATAMEKPEVRVEGAAGGLTAFFRGVGWLVFAMLTGRRFSTNRIDGGLKLVVGSIVVAAAIGSVIGAYEIPYERNPFGFRADPLSYFDWDDGDVASGAFGGAFAGLALGIFLMFLTEDPAAGKIKAEVRKALKKSDESDK
jgi:hypothetical protein